MLGICVGMQILFESGVEHGVTTAGVGEWPGVVEELPAAILPHMGWNTVDAPEGSALFAGIADERFYFVHSYAVQRWDLVVVRAVPPATGHLGRARGAVRRGHRERSPGGHAVPPGEVR